MTRDPKTQATHFGLILGTPLDLGYSHREIRAMFTLEKIRAGAEILRRIKEAA
ncbi:hypothetical protein PSQ39_21265 [Curvibacter sp. HBC28]|uniref:Uncharacterized protein n=1 Tax=Curvibacter microcysteis TaxID=3026419 RepID=A0ABT5MKS3_9BURK|nr:hypothetical protein [Curvibacter sp. HBC28]MDD0817178.1 hypothetical protein [Curvibacter sp. HBC28]